MHKHASVDIFLRKCEKLLMSICVDFFYFFTICFEMKPLKLENKYIKIMMRCLETTEKGAVWNE